jgi:hypothetical protein
MKLAGIVAALISVSNGRSPMSKTLTFLGDLDREFRNRAHMVLKEDQKETFNSQMDHIVSMFHQHDSDKQVKCYNNKASLKDGQLESTGNG